MLTRRNFLLAFAVAVFGGPAYARYLEPQWLKISVFSLNFFKKTPSRALRLLHLSDFHDSKYVSYAHIERAVTLGLEQDPDLVCLTGDMVSGLIRDFDRYRDILSRLSEHAPTYACTGNHDGGDWVAPRGGYTSLREVLKLFDQSGITSLRNTSEKITLLDRSITLAGVGDLWARDMHEQRAFKEIAPDDQDAVIALSHNPDSKQKLLPYPWNLLLCGHTHGGQLQLPYFGTPFAPVSDHRYVAGLHPWEGRWIHITRGVGNLHGIRFNCRPEVSLLELS